MSDNELSESENNSLHSFGGFVDYGTSSRSGQSSPVEGFQKPFKKNWIFSKDYQQIPQCYLQVYSPSGLIPIEDESLVYVSYQKEEAEKILKNKVSRKNMNIEDEIEELFRAFSEKDKLLPIYLQILTSYLNEHPETKIDEIIIELRKRDSFSEFLFDFISSHYKEAFELLKIIAYLDDYLIPLDFISYIQHSLDASESASNLDDTEKAIKKVKIFQELEPLIKMSIIELQENKNNVACICIHKLLQQNFQEYLRTLFNENQFVKDLMKVSIEYMRRESEYEEFNDEFRTQLIKLFSWNTEILSSFENNDLEDLLTFFENSSSHFFQSTAKKFHKIKFEIKLIIHKDNFQKLIEAYESLAKYYFELYEPLYYLKSIEIHKKCQEFKAVYYGEDNEEVVKSNDLIAKCYERLENIDEAVNWYLLSRTIRINLYGENHVRVIESNERIAEFLKSMRKYEEAIEWYEKSRQIRINLYGENHKEIIHSNNQIIECYRYSEKYEEVIEWLNRSRQVKINLYGENHEKIIQINNEIAQCYIYYYKKNYEHAIECYEKSRQIRINLYGENNEKVVELNNTIAECYMHPCGKYENAIKWYKRSRQIRICLYGENHEKVVELNNEIAWCYYNFEKHEEAVEWYIKSRQISIYLYGENHEKIIRINNEIARTYELSNKFEAAVEWYKKSREITINLYGDNYEKIVKSNNEIALCCKLFDKYESAIEWYQKSVNIYVYLNEPYNENDLRVTDEYQQVAYCYKQIGNYAQAAYLYIKCIERFEQCDRIYFSRLKEEKYYLYFQIFSCFYENACFQEAFKYYENALEHFSDEHEKKIVSYLDNLNERLDTEKEFLGKRLFISSSYDNTIKVWDVTSTDNEPLRTAPHKDSQVNCTLLLRKYLLASGHSDGKIQIWDLFINKTIETIRFEADEIEVTCLALINQEYFASYSDDEKIILWKISSEPIGLLKFEKISEINTESVCCLCAIDGELASGDKNNSIKIWEIGRNKKLRHNRDLNGHEGAVKCLLKVSNNYLVSGSEDNTIRLWNLNDYSCKDILNGHEAKVNCLVYLKNDIFASGSHDYTINIWVVKKEVPLKTIIAENKIKSLIEIPGHSIASCSTNGEIKLWSFDDYSLINTIEAHDDIISSLQPLNLEKIVHFKEIPITFVS